MIKFFRKIRQKMLIENKFSKYLIYAIGEIILVVIGILIALAINNWKENQKLRNQEITYLNNLRDDLETQINMLDIYIDYENIIIDHSNDIIEHYELNEGFKNMDSIFPKLNDLTRVLNGYANDTIKSEVLKIKNEIEADPNKFILDSINYLTERLEETPIEEIIPIETKDDV